MADKKEIEIMVAKLSAAFPNWKVTAYTVQVYLEDLQDIDSETLDAAVRMCRTETGRAFAPSTGEIRGAVSELRSLVDKTPMAADAWREASNPGGKDVPWSHPLVKMAADAAGGWYNLSHSENVASDRARFLQFYESYLVRYRNDNNMLPDVRRYIESHDPPELPERTGGNIPEFDSYRTDDGEEYFE